MKKTLFSLVFCIYASSSMAAYVYHSSLEANGGGALPNGSINIGSGSGNGSTDPETPDPIEEWLAASPSYTSWINDGSSYGCSGWTPDPSTVTSGDTFTQTGSGCSQNQTRSKQEREQEKTTLVYRNVGSPVTESNTLTGLTDTRSAIGTKPAIECAPYARAGFSDSFYIREDPDGMYYVKFGDQNPAGNIYPLSANGYTYTKGVFKETVDINVGYIIHAQYYEVCRTPE